MPQKKLSGRNMASFNTGTRRIRLYHRSATASHNSWRYSNKI